MAPHATTWKIPWTEEPGRLQSMGSRGVGYDSATSLSLFTFMHWRRKWQPTPVFLPGESQGRGSLMCCRLWGRAESDTTEATQRQQQQRTEQTLGTYRWVRADGMTDKQVRQKKIPVRLSQQASVEIPSETQVLMGPYIQSNLCQNA